jgi:hypothetical protein
MRRFSWVILFLFAALPALAQKVEDEEGRHASLFRTREKHELDFAKMMPSARSSNLSYHGGPTLTNAKVVSIFWGSSTTWGTQSKADDERPARVRGELRTTGEYNVITEYRGFTRAVSRTRIDNSTPPTNVTDAIPEGEVKKILNANYGGVADSSTIYEVYLPPGVTVWNRHLLWRTAPHVLRLPQQLLLQRRGREVRLSAFPLVQRLPVDGLVHGTELRALHLPRDPRGGYRP